MEPIEKYIGWATYVSFEDNSAGLVMCDSDSNGAFKIFKESALDEAYSVGYRHGQKDTLSEFGESLTIGKLIPCYAEDETSIMVEYKGERAEQYIMNNFKPGENMRVGKE